jgi:K+-transporting ATPase KdpF subunit
MSAGDAVLLGISVILFAYLGYAFFRPERF